MRPRTTTSRPRLVGDGPPTCSTCTDLVAQPLVIFDVNGYYRDLGADVKATRAEIRSCYQSGPQTPRTTFVTKQLLNRSVRRSYDMAALGSVFYDTYVDAAIRRSLAVRFAGGAQPLSAPDDTPNKSVLDTDRFEEQSPASTASTASTANWPYAFYLWGTDQEDQPRLREWQELLVRKLGSSKHHMQLAVGLTGGTERPVTVSVLGYRIVAFLGVDEGPTDALGDQAVSQLTQLLRSDPR